MKNSKIIQIIFLLTLALGSSVSFAQKKGSASSYSWGLGVKLGDPTGISVKKYMGNKALELVVGRTYYWGYDYYRYYDRNNDFYKNKGYYYGGYGTSGVPICFQLHYLVHKDFPANLGGLQWYYGFGGQFRMMQYYYRYRDNNGNYWPDERFTNIGVGADGVLGLEYTFDEVPIALCLDGTLYMEILDEPFWLTGQVALGIRYNIK